MTAARSVNVGESTGEAAAPAASDSTYLNSRFERVVERAMPGGRARAASGR